MSRMPTSLRRIGFIAPWITLALLPSLAWKLPNRAVVDDRAVARQVTVRRAFADVPLLIGSWIGEDQTIAVEAQELLRPNATLSRTYRALGRPSVHVLCVHCGDARDMIGHYPPVCYPTSGWLRDTPAGETDLTLTVKGRTLPVRLYEFRRMRDDRREERIRIFSAFILPDGTSSRDIDDINRQSERLAVSIQGVAQLQVLTSSSIPLEDARSAAEEVLAGMNGLFDALRAGDGER
ncbi:MAG: exosortase-associated EpsI family protein [Planctomycetota bacterium]